MQPGLAVVDGVDGVALALEQADQHPGEVLLVLDDEYPVRHGQPPAVAVIASLWTLRRSTRPWRRLCMIAADAGSFLSRCCIGAARQGGWAS